jgi:hypothetical protein
MKTKFLHLLAFIAFLQVASVTVAKAQEFPNPDLNGYQFQEPNAYDEKPLILESDLKYPKASRDTTSSTRTQTAAKTNSKTANAQDARKAPSSSGDPLNFNFLYYIIQKFKTSDLIDQ